MLYLYAIIDAAIQPDVRGLKGAPVGPISAGELTAIISEHDQLRLSPDEDDLWAHEAVVEALMDEATVLPMRFGSVLENPDAVVAVLRDRALDLTLALNHVRGAVELGVRVAIAPEPARPREPAEVESSAPGTEYLLTRLARERRTEEVGRRILESLSELARDHVPLSGATGRTSLSSAYLVERDDVDDFTGRVLELEDGLDGVTVACTGPWPPYSFTTSEVG